MDDREKPELDPNKLAGPALQLKEFLSERLVNQERAVDRVVRAYNKHVSPLSDPDSPVLATLFTGPSGVGKTYMAKLLAEFFFGKESAFTKIECENYSEDHKLSSLLGSPPGYVGYGDDPILSQNNIDRYREDFRPGPHADNIEEEYEDRLEKDEKLHKLQEEKRMLEEYIEDTDLSEAEIEAIKSHLSSLRKDIRERKHEIIDNIEEDMGLDRDPVAVILFDEVEKADPVVHNALLEIMAEGKTSLSDGQEVDMSHCFILMTSNAGSESITNQLKGGSIGFSSDMEDEEYPIFEVAMRELEKAFRPEFLGRIKDDIVVFRHLNEHQLREVLEIEVEKMKQKFQEDFPINILISDWVKDYILKKSTDHPEYGARLIKDKMQKHIVNPLVRLINSDQIDREDTVQLKKKANKEEIEFRKIVKRK